MVGNHKLGEWFVPSKHDVASMAAAFRKADAAQRIDALAA
jgi:hypothetical protein